MKTVLVLGVFFLSTVALACPNFNGAYLCKGDGIEQNITVKTEDVGGMTHYSVDETTLPADGAYHKVPYQGGLYDIRATCQGQSLTLDILFDGGQGDSDQCGPEKWNILYSLTWTPNGQNISETHSSSIVCASGKVTPSDVKGSMECVKQ